MLNAGLRALKRSQCRGASGCSLMTRRLRNDEEQGQDYQCQPDLAAAVGRIKNELLPRQPAHCLVTSSIG